MDQTLRHSNEITSRRIADAVSSCMLWLALVVAAIALSVMPLRGQMLAAGEVADRQTRIASVHIPVAAAPQVPGYRAEAVEISAVAQCPADAIGETCGPSPAAIMPAAIPAIGDVPGGDCHAAWPGDSPVSARVANAQARAPPAA